MAITFAREEISQIQEYYRVHKVAITHGHPFPQKEIVKLISS
jgi:hypothetical protein